MFVFIYSRNKSLTPPTHTQAFKKIYLAKKKQDPAFELATQTEEGEDALWNKRRPLLRFGKYDPDDDETGEGKEAFEKLMTWEKRCVCVYIRCKLLFCVGHWPLYVMIGDHPC